MDKIKWIAMLLGLSTVALSAYATSDYDCVLKDRGDGHTTKTSFILPSGELERVALNSKISRVTVNFYGDFLEVMVETIETNEVLFRTISKGSHISVDLVPHKFSLVCKSKL